MKANQMSYIHDEELKVFTKLDNMVRTFQLTLIQPNLMVTGCTGNLTEESSIFKVCKMIINLQIGGERGRSERKNKQKQMERKTEYKKERRKTERKGK
jgi:hypothetical protein